MKKSINQLKEILKEFEKFQYFIDESTNKSLNNLIGGGDSDWSDLSPVFKNKIASKGNKELYSLFKQITLTHKIIVDDIIELNENEEIKDKEIVELAVIKQKKVLTVKDVQKIYSLTPNQQANHRGRLKDPLPFMKESTNSRSSNTKILYKKEELEYWMDNFY